MPSQESNFGALYLPDNGPWITQNMDIAQQPPKSAASSSATDLSSHSERVVNSSRAKVPLPSVRQRTAQACDKCRERKTKCSGHRPVCLRCTNRGLVCEYSARLRLSTRSRFHPGYIRPIPDPEMQYSLFNYQPVAATRSPIDPLVDMCEPVPTMAFPGDEYQQGYGDPTVAFNFDYSL